jgi:hypothetical protein
MNLRIIEGPTYPPSIRRAVDQSPSIGYAAAKMAEARALIYCYFSQQTY